MVGLMRYLILLLWTVYTESAAQVSNGVLHCSGLHPQQTLDLDQVLGMWYAVEVVHHWEGPKSNHIVGRTVVDTCPVIHLSRTGEQSLRMLWTEDAGVIEYKFSINNLHKPGFWMTLGAQNGTFLNHKRYRQFAGTVEVTKAVNTHMVLTFCTPGTELYSVVLSRERWLQEEELKGVNRMLEHRGLPRLAVKQACKNAASSLILPSFVIFMALISHLS